VSRRFIHAPFPTIYSDFEGEINFLMRKPASAKSFMHDTQKECEDKGIFVPPMQNPSCLFGVKLGK
jgi:hypothetical protein